MAVALLLIGLIVVIVLVLIFGGADKKKKRKELLKEQELRKKKAKKEVREKVRQAKRESKKYVDLFKEGDSEVKEGITTDAKNAIDEGILKPEEITEILNETTDEDKFVNPEDIWREDVWQETPIIGKAPEEPKETKDIFEPEKKVEDEEIKKEDANNNDGFEFNSDLFGFTDNNDENK